MKTYGKLELHFSESKWELSDLQPHVKIKLKAIFGKVKKTDPGPYFFDHTPENCSDLAWFKERYALEISPSHEEALIEGGVLFRDQQARMEELLKPNYTPRDVVMKRPPRPYQVQGAELLIANGVLLLGDDVGLGKTITTLTAFTMEKGMLPAVVVVQTHLPRQWKEKIEEFTDLTVHCVNKTRPYQLPPADVYIFKYSQLAGWSDVPGTGAFNSVTFDEVQELRLSDSQKYEGAREFVRHTKYSLGLSATPIYNYGEEMYNIMDALKPDVLGDRDSFLREWAGGWGRTVTNPVALGTYLREKYLFLRRTREEVGQELPPVNTIVHTVETDNKALENVEATAKMLAMRTLTGAFTERGMAARELDLLLRQATGISKAKGVAAYIKILLDAGEKVLLAGWHRAVYDIWLKELAEFKPVLFTGSESPAQKDASKKAFIEGDSKLMIISLRSGIGLDGLQDAASIVAFGELDWSPQVHLQVIGRLDRERQVKQVTAIYLVSDDGSDPPMISLLGLKASQAKGIVDPLSAPTVQFSDDSRIKMLAKQYLDKKGIDYGSDPAPAPAATPAPTLHADPAAHQQDLWANLRGDADGGELRGGLSGHEDNAAQGDTRDAPDPRTD